MPEVTNYTNTPKYCRVPDTRTLTWIREEHFHGVACSRCAWLFRPTGPPTGNSLQEMKENYKRDCNEDFASHDCAEHPRAPKTDVSVNQSRNRFRNQSSRLRDTGGRSTEMRR
jgi:hypothetical protein